MLILYATYVVLRSPSYAPARKAAQVLIVWLLPVLGAVACILFSRADSLSSPASRSPEFYENVDSSGSDH